MPLCMTGVLGVALAAELAIGSKPNEAKMTLEGFFFSLRTR